MPNKVLAEHLLGLIYVASAAPTALTVLGLHAGCRVELGTEIVRKRINYLGYQKWLDDSLLDRSSLHFGRHQSRCVSKSESFGSEQFSVAGTAMDLLIRSIAGQHRIQRTMALVTVEALLVPHGTLG